jgi:hypothetical protein
MNWFDTAQIKKLVDDALAERRKHTDVSRDVLNQYVGQHYRTGFGVMNAVNWPYQYITTVAPRLAMYAPKAKVTQAGMETEETRALQTALTSWMRKSRLDKTLVQLAHDVLIDFGCVLISLQPTPGWQGGMSQAAMGQGEGAGPDEPIPMWPVVQRVSPRTVFVDSRVVELGKPRFAGHMALKSRQDLLKARDVFGERIYDEEAVTALQGKGGLDEYRKDLMAEGVPLSEFDDETVLIYHVCDLENQMCAVYAANGTDGFQLIRKPYKSDQHYVFFGAGIVPDRFFPLSPLAVTHAAVAEMNKVRAFISNRVSRAKEISVVNGTNTGLIGDIKDAPDMSLMSINGYAGQVGKIEFGTPPIAHYDFYNFCHSELTKLSSLDDFTRGNIGSGSTATEVSEAAAASDIRMTALRQSFRDSVAEMLLRVVQLMDEHPTVIFPVAETDEESGQTTLGTFIGGRDQQDDGWPWERWLTVEIEPKSMEHTNRMEEQAAMQAAQAHVVNMLTASQQTPGGAALKFGKLVGDMMRTLNLNHGADRYVDLAILEQLRAPVMPVAPAGAIL